MSDTRRRLGALARVGLTVLLVALLLHVTPVTEVLAALRRFPWSGVLLGLCLMVVQLLLGVARWARMLQRVHAPQPFPRLLEDTLIASAYNLLVPTLGGDVARALRCASRCKEPGHAWSTVLFERLVGVISLCVVAVPGLALVPGGEPLVLPTLVLALLGLAVLVLARTPLRWASSVLAARAPMVADIGAQSSQDLAGPLASWQARAEGLAWSLAYQLAGLSILAVCPMPSGDWTLVRAIYATLPLISIGTMLPVTLAGVGLRESLFVVLMGPLGVPRATALALSVLWLGSYVVLAALGILLWLRERIRR